MNRLTFKSEKALSSWVKSIYLISDSPDDLQDRLVKTTADCEIKVEGEEKPYSVADLMLLC